MTHLTLPRFTLPRFILPRAARLIAAGLLLLASHAPASVDAATDMETKLGLVAEKVATAIKGLGQDSVTMGTFSAPPQLEASSGPGIAKLLADELGKQEITVKRRAELGLKGEFRNVTSDNGRLMAKIEGQLVNRSGHVLCTFDTSFNGAAELSALFGVTVDLPADKPEKQREQKIAEAIVKPAAEVKSETRISAGGGSPYAIELAVKSAGGFQPRTVTLDEGVAFVKVDRDEIYGVRLINDSPHDAAVTLSIDGVNAFAFSDNKEYKHYIIKKGTTGLIQGWHRTNLTADSFQVGEFSKSAAASLLPSGGVIGTITATFAAAWPEKESPPADELNLNTRGGQDATIRGPLTAVQLEEVFRVTGRVRSAVSVRYSKPADLPPGESP